MGHMLDSVPTNPQDSVMLEIFLYKNKLLEKAFKREN